MILDILSLTMLQSVLMIDNVIFISVITDKLGEATKLRARLIGLVASLVMNTLFILSAGFIVEYSDVEIFSVIGVYKFNLHQTLMLFGGLFLIWKTAKELLHKTELDLPGKHRKKPTDLISTIVTMITVDMVFSIDSTLTAIGMSKDRTVQVASVLLAVLLMFTLFNLINKTTTKYPSLKNLALCFLFLIGFNLLLEGFGKDVEKGYTYAAMIFALFASSVNIWLTNRDLKLRKVFEDEEERREEEEAKEEKNSKLLKG